MKHPGGRSHSGTAAPRAGVARAFARPGDAPAGPTRRALVTAGLGLGAALVGVSDAAAAELSPELAAAVAVFAAGAPVREGRVTLEIAQLVDNGNTVPVRIEVDPAMAGQVATLALFNERNPQRDVIRARFGPRSGRARLSTRIRLATSQKLVAVARLHDGSCWSKTVDVIVTLAACIEGEG